MDKKRVDELDGDELCLAVATEVFDLVPCQAALYQPGHSYPNARCYATIRDYASDIGEARVVMRAQPEWLWCISEEPGGWVRAHISVMVDGQIARTPGYDSRARAQHSNDWDRATCVAICRTAIKAARETVR
jgi:hypothetical protein